MNDLPVDQQSSIQFDPNAVATEVITDLTKSFLAEIRTQISKYVRNNILIQMESFEKYLQRAYNKCSKVRVIIDKDRNYDLSEVYVEGSYIRGSSSITDDDICQNVRDGQNLVVQGFGGIGKTILLKHIWMSIFNNSQGKIPVFIELKRLNELSVVRLIPYIRATLTDGDKSFTDENFEQLCLAGRFTFLFDAFDEINDDKRDEVQREILSLAYRYPDCGMVVSSRKDNRFYSWEQFEIYHAQPFGKKQISSVVKKIDFDPVVKKKFQSNVLGDDYEKYSDFLSTPLLALMMLLMYRQFADIPEKIHIFYRYAFQTLYSLHDAGKESFTRQRKTDLNEDDFAKVFSLFSLMSYISMLNSFQINQLRSLINSAKTRSSISVDTDKFISEAVESVNLLYQEGDIISFVHRSFQEYFSALAIINSFSNKFPEIMSKLPMRPDDSVLMMAYEMNRDIFESNYIIPQYNLSKEYLSEIASTEIVDIDFLEKVGAKWIFLLAPGGNGTLLQESLYCVSRELNFCNITGRSISHDYYKLYEFFKGSDTEDPFLKSLTKFLSKMVPVKASRDRGSVLITLDFTEKKLKFDSLDGTNVDLGEENFQICLKTALKCQKYLGARLDRWKDSVKFLQKSMGPIMAREDARNRALFPLGDL